MSTDSSPGCVVFLIDESAGMGAVMGDEVTGGGRSTKPNAERVGTVLNSLLNRLAAGPECDLAVVGYQADAEGEVNVGCRWGGPLAGREFVRAGELAGAALRVETRTRKIPAPDGMGVAREESVEFPVWYAPTLGAKAPQIAAYDCCRELLSRWGEGAGENPGVPLVVHVSSGASGDGNPQRAVDKLLELATPAGPPLLFQVHVAGTAAAVTSLYPSTHVYLTLGSARDLFRRSSPLPPHLVAALEEAQVDINPGARGMTYNAKITDLIRLFRLVKTHIESWSAPQLAAAAPEITEVAEATVVEGGEPEETLAERSGTEMVEAGLAEPADLDLGLEKAALVVLLLDRSVDDPFSGNTRNPCARLQEHANDLLAQISKLEDGAVDVALVSYGLDPAGQVEVRNTFEGPLEGRSVVPHTELAEGALRVDEFPEEVSNNMGGLMTVTRKTPIFCELEPTGAASPAEALAAVARIADEWCAEHPSACLSPIVLHLTRGRLETAEIEEAAGQLQPIQGAMGPVSLYHLVVTEAPHPSLAYPGPAAEIEDAALRTLLELSSPLLDRERLAADKPSVTPESMGLVVNGKFDLFLEGIKSALAM